jgi:hypothetical protein
MDERRRVSGEIYAAMTAVGGVGSSSSSNVRQQLG